MKSFFTPDAPIQPSVFPTVSDTVDLEQSFDMSEEGDAPTEDPGIDTGLGHGPYEGETPSTDYQDKSYTARYMG